MKWVKPNYNEFITHTSINNLISSLRVIYKQMHVKLYDCPKLQIVQYNVIIIAMKCKKKFEFILHELYIWINTFDWGGGGEHLMKCIIPPQLMYHIRSNLRCMVVEGWMTVVLNDWFYSEGNKPYNSLSYKHTNLLNLLKNEIKITKITNLHSSIT